MHVYLSVVRLQRADVRNKDELVFSINKNFRSTRLEAGIENNVWQEQKVYVASDNPRVSTFQI